MGYDWAEAFALQARLSHPVERVDAVKSEDPHRRQIVELFGASEAHHADLPVKAASLAEPVRALLDPQGRGRQHIAARLQQLAGTRAGGFRFDPTGARRKMGCRDLFVGLHVSAATSDRA